MNLYLISQDEVDGYDTYSDAVVAAMSMEEASRIHPSEYVEDWSPTKEAWETYSASWASHPSKVSVRLIGVAFDDVKRGVICSSFHAG